MYGVKDPRRLESEMAEERVSRDKDRLGDTPEDSELAQESMDHYENENVEVEDFDLFGESYNQKFLAELEKIKAEKGSDYFKNYPSKDEIMGDNLRTMHDDMMGQPNMGRGAESSKEVTRISQSGVNT